MTEIWKPVLGYEGYYEVSNAGNVRSVTHEANTAIKHSNKVVKKGKQLKLILKNNGYYHVYLSKRNNVVCEPVHRIVANAFLVNEHNLPVVDHINANKLDNRAENLEWVTYRENHLRAREKGLYNNSYNSSNKPVRCSDNGMVFKSLKCASEWAIMNGYCRSRASKSVSRGIATGITENRKAYGLSWEFVK